MEGASHKFWNFIHIMSFYEQLNPYGCIYATIIQWALFELNNFSNFTSTDNVW